MSIKNLFCSSSLMFIFLVCLQSQDFQEFYPAFYKNGKQQLNATSGGLRNGQFSNIDFNNDGIMDLFIFDKANERPHTFLGVDDGESFKFQYAPQYESSFPRMYKYAILHDFNKDGVEDLFALTTAHVSGINVWRGMRTNDGIAFKEIIFRNDGFNSIQHIINGFSTNVYNSLLDIPAIIDADYDGDTDILTFDDSGTHVYMYKNNAVENGFGLDTFVMELSDFCFGKFYESAFDQQLFLSSDPNNCRTAKFGDDTDEGGLRHSGSSLLALDGDCDNDVDLLIGDLANYGITYAQNGGNKDNAWITNQDIHFPSYNVPVNFPLFHGMFYVDVNNDGVKDLIVSPNESDGGQNTDHVWCYINKGSNCGPVFELQTKNFLIETLVFVGGRSDPAFIDLTGDGLLDLLVGSNGYLLGNNNREDRLYYYKNTGSVSLPEFTFETDKFLDMESKSEEPGSLSPCGGDIDGDGDTDLLIGDAQGEIYFFENKAGKDKPVNFQSFEFPYENIFNGVAVKPFIFDLDGDGLNDMITGEQNNGLNYYRNVGTIGNASFNSKPVSENYGGVFGVGANAFRFFNSPSFFEIQGGKIMSLIGFNDGTLALYERIRENGQDKMIQIDSMYQDRFFGLKATNEVVDIDGDGWYDLIIGSQGGGVNFFHTEFKVPTNSTWDESSKNDFKVFPNPAKNIVTLQTDKAGKLFLYDGIGNLKLEQKITDRFTELDLHDYPIGMYVLHLVTNDNASGIKKIIKI